METAQDTRSLKRPKAPPQAKKSIPLDQLKLIKQKIGEGGEAIIHVVEVDGEKQIFKQFRKPTDPIYAKEDRELAKLRISEYLEKLNEFPQLSKRVVAPQTIILERDGSIAGYTMSFIDRSTQLSKLLHKEDREKTGYSKNQIVELFLDLHAVIKDLHAHGVVIGDFRPENILCRSGATYIIDTESMQFGRWKNHTFSQDWTDPRLCGRSKDGEIERVQDADFQSDWYAFAAMLFTALTGSSPYGGVFIQGGKLVNETDRILKRLSVLNKGAMLSSSVANLQSIDPELLKEFYDIFSDKEKRGEFPRALLERLTITDCPQCKKDFSSPHCPCGGCSQEIKAGSRIEFTPTTHHVEFPAYGKVLESRLDGNHFHSLQYSHLDKKMVRGNGEIVGALSSPDDYDRYLAFDDVQGLLNDHTLILVKDSAVQRIALKDTVGNAADLVSGNDRVVCAVTKDGLMTLNLQPKVTSSLIRSKSNLLGVWSGDAHSVTIVQSEKGELYFSKVGQGALKEILDMPSIAGTLINQHVAISGNSCWIHMKVHDLGSNFDYLFAIDLESNKVVGWTKLEDASPLEHADKFQLISMDGKECFFTNSAIHPNGYTRTGSRIIPAHVNRDSIAPEEISFVSGEDIIVFDPVPIDVLASELPTAKAPSNNPPAKTEPVEPKMEEPSIEKDTPVYGGTLNTASWLYYEALASKEPATGYAIMRNKGEGDSKYRVLHIADMLRSKSPAHGSEPFVSRFEDDRCVDHPVELFAKVTVHPDKRIDFEVGRETGVQENEAIESYIQAAKNEIDGDTATELEINGARQRQKIVVYV